jgi:hypothetical protein
MNDINKLLDEIEKLPDDVDGYDSIDIPKWMAQQGVQITYANLKALATAYREQERVVREAVEELESAGKSNYVEAIGSALSILKGTAKAD